MAGELVPLVMLPRYSTFAGATTFTTIAMDVTEYSKAILNVWRGPMSVGDGFALRCQESTDGTNWSDCVPVSPTTWPVDPGADTEAQYEAELRKRWFRVELIVTGSDPTVSCWAVGFLERRES